MIKMSTKYIVLRHEFKITKCRSTMLNVPNNSAEDIRGPPRMIFSLETHCTIIECSKISVLTY